MIQRLRVPLGFVVAAAVLYLATPTVFSIALGLPIALIGAVVRGLAAGVIKKDAQLATSGPYAWTRNPLYFGTSLLVLGFAVMSWNPLGAGILIAPFIVIYPNVIQKEEAHLEQLFGADFHRYCADVPRFLPRPHPIHLSFSLKQYFKNREYNTPLGLIGALVVLLLKTR